MIQIEDDDLPITAAHKIISGKRPGLFGGMPDMFTVEEIKEIAEYLTVFYANHNNKDGAGND